MLGEGLVNKVRSVGESVVAQAQAQVWFHKVRSRIRGKATSGRSGSMWIQLSAQHRAHSTAPAPEKADLC